MNDTITDEPIPPEAPDDREACQNCHGEGCAECYYAALSDRARWRRERRALAGRGEE